MIVIDTSALVAIVFREPDADHLIDVIVAADRSLVCAGSLLEAGIVVDAQGGLEAGQVLDRFVGEAGLEVVPFDIQRLAIAREAYLRFGRGNHKAGLNFGDCFAYALAKQRQAPLLFKGADFAATDIRPA